MIKEDETLTTSQDSSMEAIQNLNAKIDKMKSRVGGLQQENQALKEQKGTSSNDNQNENLRILMKIQEDKEIQSQNFDFKIKKLESEVNRMKKERDDILDQQMKKRFNEVDGRFKILKIWHMFLTLLSKTAQD